jgi:hypothetical protein
MQRMIIRIFWLAVLAGFPGFSAIAQSLHHLSDFPAALAVIAGEGQLVTFAQGGHLLPPGGHLQGIQWRPDAVHQRQLAFLSHDSNSVAYFLVVAIDDKTTAGEPDDNRILHVHHLPSDGQQPPLRHAGGIQLVGDVLVVGVEDNQEKKRSQVQFWNVANPSEPLPMTHLTIERRSEQPKEMTAGAVGLVERDKDHLLAVANWDSRALDFYVTNGKPLADSQCKFTLKTRWQVEIASKSSWRPDSSFGTYQAINLLADTERRVYLLGFDTTPAGQDVVDLFRVELDQPPAILQKLDRRLIRLVGDNHFRFAAGASVQDGRLLILSSERNVAPRTRLNSVR